MSASLSWSAAVSWLFNQSFGSLDGPDGRFGHVVRVLIAHGPLQNVEMQSFTCFYFGFYFARFQTKT